MEEWYDIPVADWAESAVSWLTSTLGAVFDFLGDLFGNMYSGVLWALTTPPEWVWLIGFVVIAFVIKWRGQGVGPGLVLATGTLVGFLVIIGMDYWTHTMQTLALVLVAAVIAVAIGIPLGIWASQSRRVSQLVRPLMDFMQTMPAFVYLIPAVVLFSVGIVPGIVATIIFSIPPAVRLTELGIRQVDPEVVEAGLAFGAKRSRILRQIQLPLALPSIMAGVNQVIMLALSMVVISGMVGAPGLGQEVYNALARIAIGTGFAAGLGVVIVAMFLDRLTAAGADLAPATRMSRVGKEE